MIVSRYIEAPPNLQGSHRTIQGGPLYPARDVLAVVSREGEHSVTAWTRKCIGDIQELALSPPDLRELIRIAVTSESFRGSEWCQQKPNGPWAACDAYSLIRREWIARAFKDMDIEYFIKFAIAKSGKIVLMASCHLSSNRR